MASKNKAEFIEEGARSFRSSNTRGVMPVFGESNSWQGRAFAEGFNTAKAEYAARGVAIAADIENEGEARRSKEPATSAPTVTYLLSKPGVPGAVVEHYNFLMRTAATCSDAARTLRLKNKATKLRVKWSNRVYAGEVRSRLTNQTP